MSELKNIIDWSNDLLDILIQKRSTDPTLKFWIRQRNKNNRLDDGYWFTGNENYIYVGITKLGAGNHSTKSIGFVLQLDSDGKVKCKIEVGFKKEKNEQVVACYKRIIKELGGFVELNEKQFYKPYTADDPLHNLEKFLTKDRPKIDEIIKSMGLDSKINISNEEFEKSLNNVVDKRNEIQSKTNLKIIIANITWNSKDWKEESEDASAHAWVGGENIPNESWNFDLENRRNSEGKVFGFAKFTNAPKVEGDNNLIIFYSQGKIVGFYGKAEILKDWIIINKNESYNIIGNKNLSIVLENKIENIKEKGYLEDLERIGQVGFSYLKKHETAINILNESISLNPDLSDKLNNIKKWVEENSMKEKFEKWLKSKTEMDSGKVSSYIRAITILIDHFKINVYGEHDLDVLEKLYEDLKLHQKDENGKYEYKSKSYGDGGFYSAAIRSYIEFLNQLENLPSSLPDEDRLISLLAEIGYHDSDKFYDLMENILSELNIKSGDKRICYSLPKNKTIGLTIGQKYCAIIEQKKGQNSFRYFDTSLNEKHWLKEANSIESMSDALNTIVQSAKNELNKTNKTGFENHSSVSLEESLFNKEYKDFIFRKAFNKEINKNIMDSDLNQIFFGPPGTGKTYHTINEAVKIVDPTFYSANMDNRDKLKERFRLLLLNNDNEDIGQIGFTTFHQSFSYEDFIEGIKPVEPLEGDTYLKYAIQEGIFKKICRLANDSLNAVSVNADTLISLSKEEFDKAHFYKMSLGNSQNEEDNAIFDYCVENNCVTIGFGDGLDFTGKDEKELKAFGQENNLESFPIQAMNLFCNYLKIGNYVVISNGNNYVRAIGKVVGEYEYLEESPFPNNTLFNHFRKVDWIFTNKSIAAKEIYNKNLSQQTIYKLEKKEIKQDFFVKEKKVDILKLPKNPKNYVIIIDEINRGNVSSIFGELITLIEKDKRAGTEEELSVILPYSKKEFKVPQNVYLIGTMNTADRSIESLDTALRRRFSFREMPPKHELILSEGKSKDTQGRIGNIDLTKILCSMNNRVEKLIDKDHMIGHSYFLDIETEDDLKLAFKDKIIPLLEEYFFGDFGKLSLVLGSSFISKASKADVTFAKSHEYDPSIASDLLERSVYEITAQDKWDFKAIYE